MGQWLSESFFVSILDVWRYLNYDENPSTVRSDAPPLFRLLNYVCRFARALRGRGNFETYINSIFIQVILVPVADERIFQGRNEKQPPTAAAATTMIRTTTLATTAIAMLLLLDCYWYTATAKLLLLY